MRSEKSGQKVSGWQPYTRRQAAVTPHCVIFIFATQVPAPISCQITRWVGQSDRPPPWPRTWKLRNQRAGRTVNGRRRHFLPWPLVAYCP